MLDEVGIAGLRAVTQTNVLHWRTQFTRALGSLPLAGQTAEPTVRACLES